MINFAIYFLELVSVILIIHVVFHSKVRVDLALFVTLFISAGMLYFAYCMGVAFITYLAHVITLIYCLYEFRRTWWETLLRFACSVAIIGVLETVILVEINSWLKTEAYSFLVYMGINACMLVCSCILYWLLVCKRMYFNIDVTDKTFIILVVVINIFVLYTKSDKDSRYFRLAFFIISFGLLAFRMVIITKRQQDKDLEEERLWISEYTEQYEELIQEVRRRQHDYKNEIESIKNVCMAGDGSSIVMNVIKECEDAEQYTNILNGCENPVIAGLIYSKVIAFKEDGVTMVCRVHMRNIGLALQIRELIDIIGILLDNAFECAKEQKVKRMQLTIQETENALGIETSNPCPYVSGEKIFNMFSDGYSSKGKNRGIGLHKVRQLVDKCGGDIITGNRTIDEINYFNIKIMIPFMNTTFL